MVNFLWHEIYEFNQNVHFVEIDIEEDPEIVEVAGIMGTLRVQFLENKEMLRLVTFCPFILPLSRLSTKKKSSFVPRHFFSCNFLVFLILPSY